MRSVVGMEGIPAHRFPSRSLMESRPYMDDDPVPDSSQQTHIHTIA